jgi:hypothetical protein
LVWAHVWKRLQSVWDGHAVCVYLIHLWEESTRVLHIHQITSQRNVFTNQQYH